MFSGLPMITICIIPSLGILDLGLVRQIDMELSQKRTEILCIDLLNLIYGLT